MIPLSCFLDSFMFLHTSVVWDFFFFLMLSNIYYVAIPQFVSIDFDVHLGCFQFFVIMPKVCHEHL